MSWFSKFSNINFFVKKCDDTSKDEPQDNGRRVHEKAIESSDDVKKNLQPGQGQANTTQDRLSKERKRLSRLSIPPTWDLGGLNENAPHLRTALGYSDGEITTNIAALALNEANELDERFFSFDSPGSRSLKSGQSSLPDSTGPGTPVTPATPVTPVNCTHIVRFRIKPDVWLTKNIEQLSGLMEENSKNERQKTRELIQSGAWKELEQNFMHAAMRGMPLCAKSLTEFVKKCPEVFREVKEKNKEGYVEFRQALKLVSGKEWTEGMETPKILPVFNPAEKIRPFLKTIGNLDPASINMKKDEFIKAIDDGEKENEKLLSFIKEHEDKLIEAATGQPYLPH